MNFRFFGCTKNKLFKKSYFHRYFKKVNMLCGTTLALGSSTLSNTWLNILYVGWGDLAFTHLLPILSESKGVRSIFHLIRLRPINKVKST